MLLTPKTRETLTQIEELKSKLMSLEDEIGKVTKYHAKYQKKFRKRQRRFDRLIGATEPVLKDCLLEYKSSTMDGPSMSG